MVQTSKTDHFGCAQRKWCNLNLLHPHDAPQIFRESAETTILSAYLKLKEKSVLNFMKTRFYWERLGFDKFRIFSLWDPIFEVFFAQANKGGYSSRITEQNFEKRFRTRFTAHLVHLSGVASGRILQYFLVLLSVLPVVIADRVHLKRSYRAEFKFTRTELFVERSKKTSSLKFASLSTRRFAAYAFFRGRLTK